VVVVESLPKLVAAVADKDSKDAVAIKSAASGALKDLETV